MTNRPEEAQRVRLRHRARAVDLRALKSRAKMWRLDNRQGWQITDLEGHVVAGERWELTIDEAEAVVREITERLKREAA